MSKTLRDIYEDLDREISLEWSPGDFSLDRYSAIIAGEKVATVGMRDGRLKVVSAEGETILSCQSSRGYNAFCCDEERAHYFRLARLAIAEYRGSGSAEYAMRRGALRHMFLAAATSTEGRDDGETMLTIDLQTAVDVAQCVSERMAAGRL